MEPFPHGSNVISTKGSSPLTALLFRRQDVDTPKPACGSNRTGHYNVPLHVFALFLILVLSTLACAFPILARRFPSLPIPRRFLFISRHFGTGVLIATAFIHLLPTAFLAMTDPCLPRFWNTTYPQMPGLVAMLSVFVVVTIEQVFASRGAGHTHSNDFDGMHEEDFGSGIGHGHSHGGGMQINGRVPLNSIQASNADTPTMDNENPEFPLNNYKDERGNNNTEMSDDDADDLDALDPLQEESAVLSRPQLHKRHESIGQASHTSQSAQDPQKLFLQCLLLEAGILFHSIFIGMAVSVATGTEFVVLLIAICFHQTFEGFALGARIANLIPVLFDAHSPKPWLMALAYGTTTPIGQAIGLWLHELYDPASEVGLLTVGITNAISSGLLLFAGLVQLVAEDFLSDRSYKVLSGRRRMEANLAVLAGGLLMGFVGAFA